MEEYKKEYNKLTKELLSQGYTIDRFPDYVQINSSRLPGSDPLNNIAGGFVYKRDYVARLTYKTGCGMYIKGENVLNDMSYMGIDWSRENDCPVIRCPHDKSQCPDNDPLLYGRHGNDYCFQCWCACYKTDESYEYEISLEKARADRQAEKKKKYNDYVSSHNGRVCQNHMSYKESINDWVQHYYPSQCAQWCPAGLGGYCPIRGRELSKKRGNVYYDLKTSYVRRDGTLFDGEVIIHIEKGIRYFNHPVNIDICEAFVKLQSDDIFEKHKYKVSTKQIFDNTFTAEILNIRAESKPSRDLMMDLQDLNAGITVSFSADGEKEKKEQKRERRQKMQDAKIARLEKKIIEVGYENMDGYSLDKVHAEKWLTKERLTELKRERERALREKENQPEQLTLFDF